MARPSPVQPPRAPAVRFAVDPGDIPPEKAARRLHLTAAEFRDALPRLLARGFPAPDPTTGMFDLEAIDRWRHARHLRLFPELTAAAPPAEPPRVNDMGARFVEAAKRRRDG
ncbi:hypothetical protein GCM10010994_55780 [Chelatococcus reniformis]|uniref:Uncharacterized protein n=1 Tax=Chelatococcus reniformis TaxID=1494448 RepID=A0A916XQF7_9HYPH|nr:hypothetical protein GCM10010994_55780 [Chelatococcus reniformis]